MLILEGKTQSLRWDNIMCFSHENVQKSNHFLPTRCTMGWHQKQYGHLTYFQINKEKYSSLQGRQQKSMSCFNLSKGLFPPKCKHHKPTRPLGVDKWGSKHQTKASNRGVVKKQTLDETHATTRTRHNKTAYRHAKMLRCGHKHYGSTNTNTKIIYPAQMNTLGKEEGRMR